MSYRPLNASDIIRVKSFAADTLLHLSPDGKHLAHGVINPDGRSASLPKTTKASSFLPNGALKQYYNGEIWVTDIRTGKSDKLSSDIGGNWAPQWSPDGRYVAFYSDRMGTPQLWVWDKSENKQRRISEKPVSAIYGFEVPLWTSDGKHLITKLRPEGEDFFSDTSSGADEQAINIWETGSDEHVDAARKAQRPGHIHGDLAVFDFETGKTSILTHGLYTLDLLLSPDDAAVAVLNLIGWEKLTSQEELFELLLVPLDGTPIRRLATNIMNRTRSMSWAPDGKRLAYAHPDGLFLASTQADEQKNLTDGLAEKPQFFTRPLWSPSGNSIFCGFDGHIWELPTDGIRGRKLTEGFNRHIVGIVAKGDTHVIWQSSNAQSICIQTHDIETKHDGLYQVEVAEARTTPLFEVPMRLIPSWAGGVDLRVVGYGTQIIFIVEHTTYPMKIWMFDIASGKRRQLTDLNPHLSDIHLGEARFVESRTAEGQRLRGILMLPADYEAEKRYPLVTLIYPGDNLSSFVYYFGFGDTIVHLLATRGYAVLCADVPLESNEPLKEIPKLVLPTIDKVIEMGIADAHRLGIMGYSYGGYGTVGIVAHTTRFKAAVAGGGIYNLTSYYSWFGKDGRNSGIGWAEGGQGRMRGSLWEQRQQYINNSPIFHLDKVETPLLIYCGDGYDGSDFAQSGELFSGLRRLKKTGTLVHYRGETHNPPTWRPEHRIDSLERILGWFEKYLN